MIQSMIKSTVFQNRSLYKILSYYFSGPQISYWSVVVATGRWSVVVGWSVSRWSVGRSFYENFLILIMPSLKQLRYFKRALISWHGNRSYEILKIISFKYFKIVSKDSNSVPCSVL